MIKRLHHGYQVGAIGAAFDAHSALPRRRQTVFGREDGSNTVGKPQPLQPRGRQHDGRILAVIELLQPGLHVAAQRLDFEPWKARANLAFAAQAGSSHATAVGQRGKTGILIGDESIPRIGAFGDRRNREAGRQHHRHVFHRMHRDVGAAGGKRVFELLDEQAFAADLVERAVEYAVALRGHAADGDFCLRI